MKCAGHELNDLKDCKPHCEILFSFTYVPQEKTDYRGSQDSRETSKSPGIRKFYLEHLEFT